MRLELSFALVLVFLFSKTAYACDFVSPELVTIEQLPAGSDGLPLSAEEPALSGDDRFLFFNSSEKQNNKDLHFAEMMSGRWVYQGEVGPGVNTKENVEGTPAIDRSNRFYFTDSSADSMVRVASFDPERKLLRDIHTVDGVPSRDVQLLSQRFSGSMDVEVSRDGELLLLSRATWKMFGVSLGQLIGSDLEIFERHGKTVHFDPALSTRLLARINTEALEYAATISEDGLELYFTRLNLTELGSERPVSAIFCATRKVRTEEFGHPRILHAIGSSQFVEGPALAKNGRELYYHQKTGGVMRLFKVSRN